MLHDYFLYFSYWLDPFFLIYFTIINAVYTVLLFLGSIKIYRRRKELSIEDFTYLLRSNSLPEITFLVPTYNEGKNIFGTIDSLLNLTYRYKSILVINDGSTDGTLEYLKEKYQLVAIPKYYEEKLPSKKVRGIYRSTSNPELRVIDKENGRKFDALNAGLNACKDLYYITVDADTYIDDPGFESLIRPLLTTPELIAIGASLRIRNGSVLNYNRISTEKFPQNYLGVMQSLEFLRAFLMRQGWDFIGGNYVLSGAFSIFRTDASKWAGGYQPTVADDLEIVVRLNRMFLASGNPYKIRYLPDPVGWTDCPMTLKELGRQRFLWHRGTAEAGWFHKCMLFNPRYKRFGLIVFPFLVFGEIFEPVVEVLGYIYIIVGLWLGIVNPYYMFLLLAMIWGFIFIFTLCCLLIEELSFRKWPKLRSVFWIFSNSLFENMGYRQLTLIWRMHGLKGFFDRYKEIRIDTRNINNFINKTLSKKTKP